MIAAQSTPSRRVRTSWQTIRLKADPTGDFRRIQSGDWLALSTGLHPATLIGGVRL